MLLSVIALHPFTLKHTVLKWVLLPCNQALDVAQHITIKVCLGLPYVNDSLIWQT